MQERELAILVKAVQAGDQEAFYQLFQQYKNEAYKTACLITGNRSGAEDVVQEAFVQVFLKVKSLKQPEQFRSWFYKLLTRTAWRMGKRDKKLLPVEQIFEVMDEKGQYDQQQAWAWLYDEIKQLEPKQKTVIVLYYFNGFTVKEIAVILGCLEGTVKSRLHTARKNLQASLKDDHLGQEGRVIYER